LLHKKEPALDELAAKEIVIKKEVKMPATELNKL
jgi:hypothetical protein